jgi:hypothetical protein
MVDYLKNKFLSKKHTYIPILAGLSIPVFKYIENLENTHRAKKHQIVKTALMAVRQDKRITEYCGLNYKLGLISHVKENKKEVVIRMNMIGPKNNCIILVIAEPNTHLQLKEKLLEQIRFSKLPDEEKNKFDFIPIDFNDYIIPTKNTSLKIKEVFNNEVKKLDPEYGAAFTMENYEKGFYFKNLTNSEKNQIQNDDTFYIFKKIIVLLEDNTYFNIRPINSKFRDYKIEDTYYTYNTYSDIMRDIRTNLYLYKELRNEEKEILNKNKQMDENILQKKNDFQNIINLRRLIIPVNIFLIFMGLMVYKHFSSKIVDITKMTNLTDIINKNNYLTRFLGENQLVAVSYRFDPFKWNYKVFGLILGTKKNGRVTAVAELKDKTNFKSVKFFTIEEGNKFNLI